MFCLGKTLFIVLVLFPDRSHIYEKILEDGYNKVLIVSPVQTVPFPVNPTLHVQLFGPPGTSVQSA